MLASSADMRWRFDSVRCAARACTLQMHTHNVIKYADDACKHTQSHARTYQQSERRAVRMYTQIGSDCVRQTLAKIVRTRHGTQHSTPSLTHTRAACRLLMRAHTHAILNVGQ